MIEIPAWIRERAYKLLTIAVIVVLAIILMEQADLNTLFIFKNGLVLTTPIALIAMGETISENSGVINVGVEGTTLMAALATAWTTFISGSPIIGILGGIAAGGIIGLIHAFWCIRWKANHIVSGIAINIIAMGLAFIIPQSVWGWRGVSTYLPTINYWLLVGVMIATVIVIQLALFRTLWGLRLRATGNQPEAVDITGGNVHRTRYIATVLNGILCGLAGAFLMNYTGRFSEGMVAGRGFIAIAATVVGRYVPVLVFGAAFLFGFVFSLQMPLQSYIPSQFAQSLPYFITVIAMAGLLGAIEVPKALGKHYERE